MGARRREEGGSGEGASRGFHSRRALDRHPRQACRYSGHADQLYKGYRGATSHHYSAVGVRFVDGEVNATRHWTVEEGERVLHLETFIDDLEAAWSEFFAKVKGDSTVRERVLNRAREKPPLGVRGGEPVEATIPIVPGVSIALSGANPTHFGVEGVPASSRARWPEAADDPSQKRRR